MTQKNQFLISEGDAFYRRNRTPSEINDFPILKVLEGLGIVPTRILEIGSADGMRLDELQRKFGAQCTGIDPSREAIEQGCLRYPKLNLRVGTADKLEFEQASFDLVIFGFSLYVCDPEDHFRIASEADRVLANRGFLAIRDFCVSQPYRNEYSHKAGLFVFKMEYARMFLWHPSYRLLHRSYLETPSAAKFDPNDAVTLDLLIKDTVNAFPKRAG